MDIFSLAAPELARLIRQRRVSPVEVVDEVLRRIELLNPRLNAYLAIYYDEARRAARRAELAVTSRRVLGPLHGVPVSIKDLVRTMDGPTTAGSRIFGDGLGAERDAPVVRRLRRAGAIIIGKTNLHEVALGVTSDNEHFGPVRNPWDTSRVAGGSSGGSAAAVSSAMGPLSVGSDTRGSIRIPAACCGITGLKPTFGLVSTEDVVPLSGSLDHVGPMARDADGCALLLRGMIDRRSAFVPHRRGVRGLRVGISEYHLRDLDSRMQAPVQEALDQLGRLGCRLRTVEIPGLAEVQEASTVISGSEAVAYHDATLRSHPEAFGPMVRKRLERGYTWTAVQYLHALRTREAAGAAFQEVFADVDCVAGATIPAFPPRVGEDVVQIDGREANVVESFTRFNAAQNMAGIPALALPCGFSPEGLPVGFQLMAARGSDGDLLAAGAAFQRATDWHRRMPPLG